MATTWDAWDDDVISEVPGALPEFVRNSVMLSAIDFCSDSWVWLVDQGPIVVVAGTALYPWVPPATSDVVHVLQAWLDKKQLVPKTRNELSEMYGDYMRFDGAAMYFIQDVPSALILVPKPTSSSAIAVPQVDGITAKIAVCPTLGAASFGSDEIASHYFEEIGRGAKARLLVMARKPWTDVTRGQDLQAQFDDDIATAKTAVIRSYAGARIRVRAHFF